MDTRSTEGNQGLEKERDWRPVYLGVLIYTGLLILGLTLVSSGT